jgi:hypothetical protein
MTAQDAILSVFAKQENRNRTFTLPLRNPMLKNTFFRHTTIAFIKQAWNETLEFPFISHSLINLTRIINIYIYIYICK